MQKSAQFNIDLNATDHHKKTAFQLVCREGHSDIANMLIEKSIENRIELNFKDKFMIAISQLLFCCDAYKHQRWKSLDKLYLKTN